MSGSRRPREMFVRPLPEDNPLGEWGDRYWPIVVAYVNDDTATLVSVAQAFGVTRERVRMAIAGVVRRLWKDPELRRWLVAGQSSEDAK